MAGGADTFDPLANIVTTQSLQQQRLQDYVAKMNGLQAGGGTVGGALAYASGAAGNAFGNMINGTSGGSMLNPNDPSVKRAQLNDMILQDAYSSASGETDPFKKQIAVLTKAADNFRATGNFQTASELDTKVADLAKRAAELRKLNAEAGGAETDNSIKTRTADNVVREKALDVAGKEIGNQQKVNEGINFIKIDPKGGPPQMVNVASMENPQVIAALRASGYVEAAKPALTGGTKELTNQASTQFEEKLMSADQSLAELKNVNASWKPEYSSALASTAATIGNAVERYAPGAIDALPGNLKESYKGYLRWQTNSIGSFNNYVHAITGAQMSAAEAVRLQSAYADALSAGPTKYQEQIRAVVGQLLGTKARYEHLVKANPALAASLAADPQGSMWDSIPTQPASEQDITEFLKTTGLDSVYKKASEEHGAQTQRERLLEIAKGKK